MIKKLILLVLCGGFFFATTHYADTETIIKYPEIKTRDGCSYKNATITRVNEESVYIIYELGGQSILITNLLDNIIRDLQPHIAVAKQEAEQKQAEAERKQVEAERKQAEAQRQQAEAERKQKEAEERRNREAEAERKFKQQQWDRGLVLYRGSWITLEEKEKIERNLEQERQKRMVAKRLSDLLMMKKNLLKEKISIEAGKASILAAANAMLYPDFPDQRKKQLFALVEMECGERLAEIDKKLIDIDFELQDLQ